MVCIDKKDDLFIKFRKEMRREKERGFPQYKSYYKEKIKEKRESMNDSKVTIIKEYSKEYNKVGIHIETTIQDMDTATMIADDYLQTELSKIPDGGFTKPTTNQSQPKSNNYSKPNNYNKPKSNNYNNNNNYNNQPQGGDNRKGRDFGSEKQWNMLYQNYDKLMQNGINPDVINDYNELQGALKVAFSK